MVGTKTKPKDPRGATIEESTVKAAMSFKKAGAGFALSSKPTSFSMKRDGQEIKHPLLATLGEIATTLQIDAKGKATAITGYENLTEKLKQVLPPELFKVVAPSLSPQALETKEIAEWQGRVGELAGQELEMGAGYVSESQFPLPDGRTVPFVTALKAASFVTVAGRKCVKLEFKYNSDAKAFAGFANGVAEAASKLVDPSGKQKMSVNQTSASISGEGWRIVDPATMLIYAEKTSRTIKMTMTVPGQGEVPALMTETRQYDYQYK
jgi:hypothetical protein